MRFQGKELPLNCHPDVIVAQFNLDEKLFRSRCARLLLTLTRNSQRQQKEML
jgi:hypothetical protein